MVALEEVISKIALATASNFAGYTGQQALQRNSEKEELVTDKSHFSVKQFMSTFAFWKQRLIPFKYARE